MKTKCIMYVRYDKTSYWGYTWDEYKWHIKEIFTENNEPKTNKELKEFINELKNMPVFGGRTIKFDNGCELDFYYE
jgi:hypothetical protein